MRKPSYFYLLLFSLALGLWNCSGEKSEIQRPNILFILADDLGYADLSCMGSTYYETPHIDKIAEAGITFSDGYAACQVCSPSRASILTGKFTARHGITDWIGAKTGTDWRSAKRYSKLLPPDYNHVLSSEDSTLAEVFRANGYATFFAGKWHLGNEGSYPTDHGFNINRGGYEKGGPYSGGYFSPFNNPQMEDYPEEVGMSLSSKLANETITFIEENQDNPFLAYLSFYAVHAPIQTTEENWKYYREKAVEQGVDSTGFHMERRLPIRKYQDNPVYAGLVKQMDDGVGLVMKALERLNLLQNTIIIFTSDNGGVASGDAYATSNEPLRGGKGYQWEGGIRVPFLMQLPSSKMKGKVIQTPVSSVDFYPTLLELCDIPQMPEQHLDGISLVPLIHGESKPERNLIWHYPHYGNQGGDPSSIIRQGPWKLIYYWESGQSELYNLHQDLPEKNNVIQEHFEKGATLKKALDEYLMEVNAATPKPDPQFYPDSAALKQIYYQTELKDRLEKQRQQILQENWQPNQHWWGSKVSKN